jgi:2'-5' RNA ligase
MAEASPKSERVRMFVALDLPERTREGIAMWGTEALTDPALRTVAPESLHITLAFLGLRPQSDVESLTGVLTGAAAPAPLVELRGPVGKPTPTQPRLFALPALSPGAEQIQAHLRELLVAEDLYEPEKRPFWPHVTVARVRSEGRGSRRPMGVQRPPKDLPGGLEEVFYGVRLTLYRSVLQPSGARYVPLAQVELPGAGWQ